MQTILPHLIPGSEQQNSLVADSQKNDLRRETSSWRSTSLRPLLPTRLWRRLEISAFTYKVGMQLYTAEGPQLVRDLVRSGKRVFLYDLEYP